MASAAYQRTLEQRVTALERLVDALLQTESKVRTAATIDRLRQEHFSTQCHRWKNEHPKPARIPGGRELEHTMAVRDHWIASNAAQDEFWQEAVRLYPGTGSVKAALL